MIANNLGILYMEDEKQKIRLEWDLGVTVNPIAVEGMLWCLGSVTAFIHPSPNEDNIFIMQS